MNPVLLMRQLKALTVVADYHERSVVQPTRTLQDAVHLAGRTPYRKARGGVRKLVQRWRRQFEGMVGCETGRGSRAAVACLI